MKRITIQTVVLTTVLFLITIACLRAADGPAPAPAAGFLKSQAGSLWIPILVPSLIAGLKALWPSVPKQVLPFLCPILGAGLGFLGTSFGQDVDPAVSTALGALGNWVREAFDQCKKALDRAALAMAGLVLICQPASAGAGELERFSVSPFASYRVHEFGQFDGKWGGGLAFGYKINRQVTLEAETIMESFDDSHWGQSFTEAGGNFKLDLIKPLKSRPVIPYALIGYTRDLQGNANRMNAGAGLDLRFARRASAFIDGRWTHDFETLGHALFRAGLSLRF